MVKVRTVSQCWRVEVVLVCTVRYCTGSERADVFIWVRRRGGSGRESLLVQRVKARLRCLAASADTEEGVPTLQLYAQPATEGGCDFLCLWAFRLASGPSKAVGPLSVQVQSLTFLSTRPTLGLFPALVLRRLR